MHAWLLACMWHQSRICMEAMTHLNVQLPRILLSLCIINWTFHMVLLHKASFSWGQVPSCGGHEEKPPPRINILRLFRAVNFKIARLATCHRPTKYDGFPLHIGTVHINVSRQDEHDWRTGRRVSFWNAVILIIFTLGQGCDVDAHWVSTAELFDTVRAIYPIPTRMGHTWACHISSLKIIGKDLKIWCRPL